METIAISTPVAGAAVQTATQTQAGDGQVSFAQLLYGLTGTAQGGGQQQSATGDLSWRGMQAIGQLIAGNTGQAEDGSQLSIDALLSQLLGLLGQMREEDVAQALGGDEDAGEVMDSIDKLRRQMEQWMATSGQGGESMMFLLAQVYELPLTPQVGEDGTITLTVPQSDAFTQLLQSSEPSELLAKLTGLPTETIQKLLESQQAAPAAGQATQAATANTGELPVVQTAGTQTQTDGEAAFQSSIRTAKQQMETGEAKSQTGESKVDVDELQRQVDEGVHFKNTSYSSAVQTEAKAEQTARPLLTQVQDGIIKAIEQGDDKFSIRLVPEGLGELEVRLTKTSEGMLLNIVTKSAEAQRLLTAEIDQLREQMRAYKVEVDSILTEQQDDFLQRQRDFEQQAWQNSRQDRTRYQTDARNQTPEAIEMIQTVHTRLAGQALDTYI